MKVTNPTEPLDAVNKEYCDSHNMTYAKAVIESISADTTYVITHNLNTQEVMAYAIVGNAQYIPFAECIVMNSNMISVKFNDSYNRGGTIFITGFPIADVKTAYVTVQ